jgi:hypothetical protein
MVDLTDAGRRLAAFDAGPTTAFSTLQRRARGRIRRRRALTVVGTGILAAVVVFGALHLHPSAPGGRGQQVATGGIPGGPPTVLPTVTHPAAWDRHVIGDLSFWTPPTWYACDYGVNGPVAFEPARPCPLGSTGQGAPLVVRSSSSSVWPAGWKRSTGTIPAGVRETIDHVAVFEEGGGRSGAVTYDVPSLGVSLVATTPAARQIVSTLAGSALHAVLSATYPVAVPAGWRTVDFGGIAASVPASWPVRAVSALPGRTRAEPRSCTLFAEGSIVYLGRVRTPCTASEVGTFTPGLWIGTATEAALGGRGARLTVSTVMRRSRSQAATVTIRSLTVDQSDLIDLTVSAGARMVEATMGVGTEPAIAEEIISSLRPS